MRSRTRWWLGAALVLVVGRSQAGSPAMTFDLISKSRKCEPKKHGDGAMLCTYRATGFLLEVDGVGTEGVVVSVLEARMDGGLIASYDTRSTCVKIQSGSSGPMGTAYVSTKDGQVYRSSRECQSRKSD